MMEVKVKVHTLDIVPLRESSLQKRSGMARILKGSHRYLHTHTFIARWPGQRTNLGMIPGLCAKVRSSELRHVCYRINILGSQLSPSSINLVPASAGKVTVGLSSHWPCVNRHRFIHLRAQRPKTGR